MTNTPFKDLKVGDWIADMHYGLTPIMERFEVVTHVCWDEPRPDPLTAQPGAMYTGYVEHAFFNYLSHFLPRGSYGNKMLHVIGTMRQSFPKSAQPELVCGYCYDGRWSGIVVLRERP